MKLAGWKANLLYKAGRTVLIQASSLAIPSYIMQSCMLPGKVLEGIDRVKGISYGVLQVAEKRCIGWDGGR